MCCSLCAAGPGAAYAGGTEIREGTLLSAEQNRPVAGHRREDSEGSGERQPSEKATAPVQWVSQLGKHRGWKELRFLCLASSRAPCPDFCLISSILHFKTLLMQFQA